MLSLFARLLKVLNSEDSEQSIAWAITLAFIFALLPLFSGLKWLILGIVILLRVHLASFILFSGLFTILAYLADPLMNQVGLLLLQDDSLRGFWVSLYNSSVGSVLAINNTLALTSLLASLVVFVPLYFLSKWLIIVYRRHLKGRIERLRVVQVLKSTKLYNLYQKIS